MKDPRRDAPGRPEQRTTSPAPGGVAQYGGLGLQFGAAVGFFTWGGYKLDEWLGSSPWLTLLGALLGAGAAFYSIYRKVFPRAAAKGDGR